VCVCVCVKPIASGALLVVYVTGNAFESQLLSNAPQCPWTCKFC